MSNANIVPLNITPFTAKTYFDKVKKEFNFHIYLDGRMYVFAGGAAETRTKAKENIDKWAKVNGKSVIILF